jgi:hypothetical protein
LYVDDLLIACSSFEEASRARQIIEDTLLATGIVRAPLKGCFDTPTQTLSDHISSIGNGTLRVPERRCFALCRQARALLFEATKNRRLVESDLLRRFSGASISCFPAVPLTRFHLREVFNAQEQYKSRSFLSQAAVDNLLFWRNFSAKSPENLQEHWPDQPSTALYTDRRIGHHRLGFGVGTAPRGNEIERWMVGVGRSAGNDSAQGAQGVTPRLVSECRSPARPHGQALPGQPGQAVCGALSKMSSK